MSSDIVEYEHHYESFDKGEPILIPEDAEGITTGTFGNYVTVHYLTPVGETDE